MTHASYDGTQPTAEHRPYVSVVSPVYCAEAIVDELVRRVSAGAAQITPEWELLLVEDGGPDRSWQRIAAACERDPRIKGVRLSRNFGQHAAITAGLSLASGAWVAVIDCDLQEDPAYLADLHAAAIRGYDVVLTVRESRRHGLLRDLGAAAFTGLLSALGGAPSATARVGTLSLLSRKAVEAYAGVRDVHRHHLNVLRWLGFRTVYLPVRHAERLAGRSSYTFLRLLRHFVDGVVSQSNRPLYFAFAAGAGFAITALAALGWAWTGSAGAGEPSVAPWLPLFVLVAAAATAVLGSIGILGIYVAKVFDQVRGRPLYLVDETRNL